MSEAVRRASAPGKLFLTGEWAVLRGAPALVAAVDRRARVEAYLRSGRGELFVESVADARTTRLDAGARPAGDAAAVAAVLGVLRPPGGLEGTITVDSSAFLQGGCKLGLGRSAATLVATAAAVLAHLGRDDRTALAAAALAANAALQGGLGSGADVLAALHGGVVEVRRTGEHLDVAARSLPAGIAVLAAWTGASAPTGPLLRRFEERMRMAPPAAVASLRFLAVAATDAATAVASGDGPGFLEAAQRGGDEMAVLAAALDLSLVTPALARLVRAARGPGVAAKPSGAGGGDCGIALVSSRETAAAVRAAWEGCGFAALDVEIDPRGVALG